jgi:hypothetical protein
MAQTISFTHSPIGVHRNFHALLNNQEAINKKNKNEPRPQEKDIQETLKLSKRMNVL